MFVFRSVIMRNNISRIISLIMVGIILSSSFLISANATSNTITSEDVETLMGSKLNELFITLKTVPEDLGLTLSDVEDAYVGQSFSIANVTAEGDYEAAYNILYLPVISNNEVIAVASVHKDSDGFSCSIGKKFAEQLEVVIKSTNGNFALVADEMDIIAVDTANNTEFIVDYVNNDTVDTYIYEDVCDYNNVINAAYIYNKSYDLPVATPPMTRAYNYFNSYPIVYQGNYNICWAAVVASMVMYELPSQYSELYATHVCNKIGHSYTAGSVSDVMNALEAYLPSSYNIAFVSRALTKNEVISEIDSNDPAAIFLTTSNATMGHVVAMCGYRSTSSSFQVRYMDPYFQEFEFAYYESSGFDFVFGTTSYTWVYTVKI